MATLTGYSTKPSAYFAEERREMLELVPQRAARLLEIGCGRGRFAAALKATRTIHITAIEPFAEAAAQARSVIDRVIESDVETGVRQLEKTLFDCIVFNDVLEHLVDPWVVLGEVMPLLAPDGVVVASIPNMRYAPVLSALVLRGEWQYREDGVLDKTHLRFFTQKSAADMFVRCGYRVRRIAGINPGRSWRFGLLTALTFGAFADTRYRQIAVTAERPA